MQPKCMNLFCLKSHYAWWFVCIIPSGDTIHTLNITRWFSHTQNGIVCMCLFCSMDSFFFLHVFVSVAIKWNQKLLPLYTLSMAIYCCVFIDKISNKNELSEWLAGWLAGWLLSLSISSISISDFRLEMNSFHWKSTLVLLPFIVVLCCALLCFAVRCYFYCCCCHRHFAQRRTF